MRGKLGRGPFEDYFVTYFAIINKRGIFESEALLSLTKRGPFV